MVSAKSYTRLTLGLDIVGKLTTGPFKGYHELGIIKQQVTLGDTISIKESDQMKLTCNHPDVPEDSRNICWQAVELIQKEFNITQNVTIDIDKVIPVQGGLAGGSTNAATTIQLLDEAWELNIPLEKKMNLGRQLGMDVPFYFIGGCAFDSEATGILEPIEHDQKMYFVLVIPPFGVSTAEAYKNIDYSATGLKTDMTKEIKTGLIEKKYDKIVNAAHNDFELSVFPQFPKLTEIKNKLLQDGADASFMSGSGSTMIGIFDSMVKAEHSASFFSNSYVVEAL